MANRSVVVRGTVAEVEQSFLQALAGVDGTATTQVPGQPIKFNLKDIGKKGLQDWRYFTFEGSATLLEQPDACTRIDMAVSCPGSYFLYAAACAIVGLVIAFMIPGFGIVLWLIALIGVGWSVYQASSVYPEQLADRIVSRIPGIVTIGSASPPSPAVATASPPLASGGSVVAEQLKKLGELHSAGVLTDAEFAAKKTELLKRL